jgi:hypothetical protein
MTVAVARRRANGFRFRLLGALEGQIALRTRGTVVSIEAEGTVREIKFEAGSVVKATSGAFS